VAILAYYQHEITVDVISAVKSSHRNDQLNLLATCNHLTEVMLAIGVPYGTALRAARYRINATITDLQQCKLLGS